MGSVITLTTDFGQKDAYVAAMKGVILNINPEITLVDICHNIQPQNIQQAAFLLSTAYKYFPAQTIHVLVVDPGVGTSRSPIILKTPRYHFVAPDNGVLSYVIKDFSSEPVAGSERVEVGEDLKAYLITKSEYWLKPVSNTFHGRDIFAPIAARLSLGMPASSLGINVDKMTSFVIPFPSRSGNSITGQVLHVDNFGNLITNITEGVLPSDAQSITVLIGQHTIRDLDKTYAGGDGLIALFGSGGYLEISRTNGNASEFLRAQIGENVRIEIKG